jgi:hypothetical protein
MLNRYSLRGVGYHDFPNCSSTDTVRTVQDATSLQINDKQTQSPISIRSLQITAQQMQSPQFQIQARSKLLLNRRRLHSFRYKHDQNYWSIDAVSTVSDTSTVKITAQ